MALKNNRVNPLNALGIRQLTFPSPHLHYIQIDNAKASYLQSIDRWIFHNLNGRYYIGNAVVLEDDCIQYAVKIGFEQEKELSFFGIAAPSQN